MASKIGFIGAGRMAQALANGFIAGGIKKPSEIICSTPKNDLQSISEMKRLDIQTVHDNKEILESSEIVIMAVKPNVVPKVIHEIRNEITIKNVLVSIALGVPIKAMEDVLPLGSRIIRVMSNTPAVVRNGATVYSLGTFAHDQDGDQIKKLFLSVGTCDQVPESAIDAVTGLSGSGPAYCYMAIEALADGGVRQGLPRDLALKLAAQTLLGSAKMVLETGRHPGALKDDVCSPAGCTIAGLSQLERLGFRSALIEAVHVATEVAQQTAALSKSTNQNQNIEQEHRNQSSTSSHRLNGKKIVLNNILQ